MAQILTIKQAGAGCDGNEVITEVLVVRRRGRIEIADWFTPGETELEADFFGWEESDSLLLYTAIEQALEEGNSRAYIGAIFLTLELTEDRPLRDTLREWLSDRVDDTLT